MTPYTNRRARANLRGDITLVPLERTAIIWAAVALIVGAVLATFAGYTAFGVVVAALFAIGGVLALQGRPVAPTNTVLEKARQSWWMRPAALRPEEAERLSSNRSIFGGLLILAAAMIGVGLLVG